MSTTEQALQIIANAMNANDELPVDERDNWYELAVSMSEANPNAPQVDYDWSDANEGCGDEIRFVGGWSLVLSYGEWGPSESEPEEDEDDE